MSMKNSDTIGNRSRDLLVCSAVLLLVHYTIPNGSKIRDHEYGSGLDLIQDTILVCVGRE
jgi:hypothetical protein